MPPPAIPPRKLWPRGFTTDYVTGAPDRPLLWAPGRWPWQWFRFRSIDLRNAAWWHDVRYYLGFFVAGHGAVLNLLPRMRPRPNEERNETQRRVIDQHFYVDALESNLHRHSALVAKAIVRKLGKGHYYWATPEEIKRRGLERLVKGRKRE